MNIGKLPQLDKDMEKKARAITTHDVEIYHIFTLKWEYNKKCPLSLLLVNIKLKVQPL